jgi:arylsulfatase A-like enzyme
MARLLVVTIDGICSATLKCAHVSCLDRLAAQGVFLPNLRPLIPAVPVLPTLLTAFTGLSPLGHGVLTNSPLPGAMAEICSLFTLLRSLSMDCALFHSLSTLQDLAPKGTLTRSLLIEAHGLRNVDQRLAGEAARCLQHDHPDLCVLCLQGPEIAGQHFGYMSAPYLESVEQADLAVALVLEQMRLVGLEQEYRVVVFAGHGGSWEQVEPGESAGASGLPLIIQGAGLPRGRVNLVPVPSVDLAPTLVHLLDLHPHPAWPGRVRPEVRQEEKQVHEDYSRWKPVRLTAA